MSSDDKKGVEFKFNFWRFLYNASYILILCSVVLSVAAAVYGIIVYKKYGFYPCDFKDITAMLKNEYDDIHFMTTTDPLYCVADLIGNVLAIIMMINIIFANVINFSSSLVREIISIICMVALFVLTYLQGRIGSKYDVALALGMLALIIIMFLCIKGTEGGRIMLISFGTYLFGGFGIPLIMWVFSLTLGQLVSVLALILVGGACLIGFLGSPGGSSAGSPAVRDRNDDKIRNEINALDRRTRDNAKGIQEHQKGSWSYGHVDEEATRKQMDEDIKRKRMLEDQLDKK